MTRTTRLPIRALMSVTGMLALSAGLVGAPLGPPASADAPAACVQGGACYPGVQEALDAAPADGTVRLSAGEFAGGVVITRSVRLVGAGSGLTTVRGGGPVILALAAGDDLPTVRISDVTVTGGLTDGYGNDPGTDPGYNADGGGIAALSTTDGLGPTLVLHRVVVTGNVTAPGQTFTGPDGIPCPDGDCPYAGAYGAGIFSAGDTWVVDSTVSDNTAGGHASDADGAGIFALSGGLHVIRSVIADNRAVPKDIGRFAEGGGIFAFDGNLEVRDSQITGNLAELVTDYPVRAGDGTVIDMNANGGGIHVGDGGHTRIVGSRITGNTVRAVDPVGEPLGIDAAMLVGNSALTMRDTVVADNYVYVEAATAEDVGPSGSAVETDAAARLVNTRIVDNRSVAVSADGTADVGGALAVFDFFDHPRRVIARDSEISGNVALARSDHGTAVVHGAGVLNNSLLRLAGTRVVDNVGRADAPGATAQGGGIWNGPLVSGPPVQLDLLGSRVSGNRLIAPGGTREGGGIYTTLPIDLTRTAVVDNRPDDCVGCDSPLTREPLVSTPSRARASTSDPLAGF